MNIKLLKIDQSDLWISNSLKGRIFGTYIFNADRRIKYAGCQSYEILFVHSEMESPDLGTDKSKRHLLDGDLITAESDFKPCLEIDNLPQMADPYSLPAKGGVISVSHIPALYEYPENLDAEDLEYLQLERTRAHFLTEEEVFFRFYKLLSQRIAYLKHFDAPKYGGIPIGLIGRVPKPVLDLIELNLETLSELSVRHLRERLVNHWQVG
jgi:hypothetical protein